MLVSAVVCPHPPALVPEVSHGGADELDAVRDAGIRAVRRLAEVPHDALLCVGAGPATVRYDGAAAGGWSRYGASSRSATAKPELPLSLTVGHYLLAAAGPQPTGYQCIADAEPAEACREIGEALAGEAPRVALLV